MILTELLDEILITKRKNRIVPMEKILLYNTMKDYWNGVETLIGSKKPGNLMQALKQLKERNGTNCYLILKNRDKAG